MTVLKPFGHHPSARRRRLSPTPETSARRVGALGSVQSGGSRGCLAGIEVWP